MRGIRHVLIFDALHTQVENRESVAVHLEERQVALRYGLTEFVGGCA